MSELFSCSFGVLLFELAARKDAAGFHESTQKYSDGRRPWPSLNNWPIYSNLSEDSESSKKAKRDDILALTNRDAQLGSTMDLGFPPSVFPFETAR